MSSAQGFPCLFKGKSRGLQVVQALGLPTPQDMGALPVNCLKKEQLIIFFSIQQTGIEQFSVPATVLAVKALENSVDMFLILVAETEK